jgi:glucosamine-6-phosphate deaminase
MRLQRFEDEAAVAVHAAGLLEETVGLRRDARVILPAGRTPLPLFDEILRRARAGLDLAPVRFFQLDEYVGVGPKDPRSFHAFLRERLLAPLGREPRQDFLLDGTAADPRAEIERHAAQLSKLGGADLAFLGLGRNGHVGFNEPGSAAGEPARVVELARETRSSSGFEDDAAPKRGMTLGLRELAAARRLVLLVTGAAKTRILAALEREPPSPERPASLLLGHRDFRILADAAAAARRTEEESEEPCTPPATTSRGPRASGSSNS